MELWIGITTPFVGTLLGAACVFFVKDTLGSSLQKLLLGFAAGVMVAASVWSLLIPAMDMSEEMGRLAFIPAVIGFLLGIMFLYIVDKTIPHLHMDADEPEGPKSKLKKTTMMVLAITLHNIPEGMAVGVALAGSMSADSDMTFAAALALALGIAIQNFPEGAIIALPLRENGLTRGKAFRYGTLTGVVEPLSAVITILLSSLILPALPYLLAFAAGAMIYVVVEDLIPETAQGSHSNLGTLGFAAGFVLMMILDVALG